MSRTVAVVPRRGPSAAIALALTPATVALLALPAGGWLFALAAPLALWPAFSAAIRADRDGAAFRSAVIWALLISASVLLFVHLAPATAGRAIVQGETYRVEMFVWIESGEGKEGDWRRFLPEHAVHLAAFALLSVGSAGYLGLALGAGLLAYMNYFVASVMRASSDPAAALFAAWFPWSVSRVLAFIALGALLARPLLKRSAWPFERRHTAWILAATAGIALDIALKVILAEPFRQRLLQLIGAR